MANKIVRSMTIENISQKHIISLGLELSAFIRKGLFLFALST
jgi:hypothetical protein